VSSWIVRLASRSEARLRLFCFPFAGGGAYFFRDWGRRLSADVEILGIQPPGREDRLTEPAFTRLEPLVEAAAAALRPHLTSPYAFVGHSMGALVAFETTRQLQRLGWTPPAHLVLSSWAALTHRPIPKFLDPLSDRDLRDRLQTYQGTPDAVLQNAELMRAFLPTLRADFAVCDTYRPLGEEPLTCPLTVFGGRDDPVITRQGLEAWRGQTTGAFTVRTFPGGHFYLKRCPEFFTALSEVLVTSSGGSTSLAHITP
jgi:medium-chain acyl-[acyl-carrier-protein] hydrolase